MSGGLDDARVFKGAEVVAARRKRAGHFTDGQGLSPRPSAIPASGVAVEHGQTSSWKINIRRLRCVDCVILYLRDGTIPNGARILRCHPDHERRHRRERDGRHTVKLRGIHQVGTTTSNWKVFAETGAQPLRYIRARS
jgi:hypothetical protein